MPETETNYCEAQTYGATLETPAEYCENEAVEEIGGQWWCNQHVPFAEWAAENADAEDYWA